MPELSYGSHIFQDLVEANILYGAVFDNEKTIIFQPDIKRTKKNILTQFCPDDSILENIISVYDVRDMDNYIYHDIKDERLVCTL